MCIISMSLSMSFTIFLDDLLALEETSFDEDIFTQGFKTDKKKQSFTVLVTTPSLIRLIFEYPFIYMSKIKLDLHY